MSIFRLSREHAQKLTSAHLLGLSPSFKSDTISENDNVKKWIGYYLDIGETVMDTTVALAGTSGWFERKR